MIRLVLFWFSIILGGLLLGAAESKPSPSMVFNWDAVGALAVIATGFVGGTWFIVSMAIHSAILASERVQTDTFAKMITELRAEMWDKDAGFVSRRECDLLHAQTRDAIARIEAE